MPPGHSLTAGEGTPAAFHVSGFSSSPSRFSFGERFPLGKKIKKFCYNSQPILLKGMKLRKEKTKRKV
jgi:hypothetical protein